VLEITLSACSFTLFLLTACVERRGGICAVRGGNRQREDTRELAARLGLSVGD